MKNWFLKFVIRLLSSEPIKCEQCKWWDDGYCHWLPPSLMAQERCFDTERPVTDSDDFCSKAMPRKK